MSGEQVQNPKPSNDSESPEAKRAREEEKYKNPMCVCEETEPEPQSEYDVSGDWVTYDGPINADIYNSATINASADLEAQMKEYYAKLRGTAPRASAPPVTPSPGLQPAYDSAVPTDSSPEADSQADDEWHDPLVEMYVRDATKQGEPTDEGADAAAAAGPDACVLGDNSADFAVTHLE